MTGAHISTVGSRFSNSTSLAAARGAQQCANHCEKKRRGGSCAAAARKYKMPLSLAFATKNSVKDRESLGNSVKGQRLDPPIYCHLPQAMNTSREEPKQSPSSDEPLSR